MPVDGHPGHDVQRGQQAVAGGGGVGEHDVAALLAAEGEVAGAQRLEHVAVADGGRHDLDAGVAHGVVEAEVAHDGGDDGVLAQPALLACSASAQMASSWSPSTTGPAASTARQRSASPSWAMPRSAPVARTAAIRPSRWVEPTPSLMFRPSGLGRDGRHLGAGRRGRARARRSTRRRARSRRRRAARPDAWARHSAGARRSARRRRRRRAADRCRARSGGASGRSSIAASISRSISSGSLCPPAREQLDAVVRHRVVRRREHDPEVGAVGRGQVGDGRGRQHADRAARRPRRTVRPATTAASSISPLARGSRPTTATGRCEASCATSTRPRRRRRTARARG